MVIYIRNDLIQPSGIILDLYLCNNTHFGSSCSK